MIKRILLSFALLGFATPTFAVTIGTLTVTTTQLSSGSMPIGAQRLPMLQVTLQASCDAAATVRTITVYHEGLGAVSDISRVYALEGATRVTRAAVLQRNAQTATLRF